MIIDPKYTFHEAGNGLVIERAQEIPDAFLTELSDHRHASASRPMGDMARVASVPTALVEQWAREGFDVYREPARAIVARLTAHNLGAFITTTRSI